jgi:hypothetical protein
MVRRGCPNDGMVIPQVAEVLDGAEPVRFFWCWSCMELFAFLGDPGTLTAGFAEDGRGGWRVFWAAGGERDLQSALAAVAQVKPDGARWSRLSQRCT